MTTAQSITVFRLVSTVVLLLAQWYAYRVAVRNLGLKKSKKRLAITRVLFLYFNATLLAIIFLQPHLVGLGPVFVAIGVYPFYIWHFAIFIISLIMLIANLISLPIVVPMWIIKKMRRRAAAATSPRQPMDVPDPRRRVVMRQGVTILAGAVFASATYGAFRKNAYEITTTRIQIPHLPASFEGFTVVQISDIHSSVFMSKELMTKYVALVNGLNPNLIVVTGDFVNNQAAEVYPLAEAFSELKAPSGVYGVLGNHDYYTRDVETVARHVNDCGVRLLVNDQVAIEKNGERIYLLGIDDVGNSARAGMLFDQSLAGVPMPATKIMMCHRPYFFQAAADRNIDLLLSGHTHGGQVVFMKNGNNVISPARIASPYISGLYTIGESRMYVSRGLGTVGIPVRINCPPEITKLVLTRGA